MREQGVDCLQLHLGMPAWEADPVGRWASHGLWLVTEAALFNLEGEVPAAW